MRSKELQITLLIIFSFLLILFTSLLLNNWKFMYALDDPYISLRIAEMLAEGGYGINKNEFATLSSSLIWPFILLPFIKLPFAEIIPLFINLAACIFTGLFLVKLFQKNYKSHSVIISYFILFLSGSIGVIFTGMEHSIQILLTVMVVCSLIEFIEEKTLPKWLPIILIIAPLVRYELLSVSIGAIIFLILHKQYKYFFSLFFIALIMSATSFFLWQKTGYIFPASAINKSNEPSIEYHIAAAIILFTAILSFLMFNFSKEKSKFLLFGFVISILVAHLIFSKVFLRYEFYAVAAGIIVFCYYNNVLEKYRFFKKPLEKFTPLLIISQISFMTISTPYAINKIYSQHGQMKRLVEISNFPKVGVNDIGFVSFRSPSYVLDLWALGDVNLKKIKNSEPGTWLNIAKKKNVELVMIYPKWFANNKIPKEWVKLGTLELVSQNSVLYYYNSDNFLDIYVTSNKNVNKYKNYIKVWQKDLPENAVWVSS